MKGDFTRDLFDPTKHYSGVLMQQGRVQLDADWNERENIQRYRTETEALDVIGTSGAPAINPGFAIAFDNTKKVLTIGQGRYYVEGLLCENEADVQYDQQPDLINPPAPAVVISGAGTTLGIAYLDVWKRHLTALEDSSIREVALGGADTTTRVKTVWQVKVIGVKSDHPDTANPDDTFPEWDALVAPSTGALSARAQPASAADQGPCLLPPTAGFRRLENQLYRVEVHQPGGLGTATFKWSRDNGTVVTSIEKFNGQELTLHDVGRDEVLGFAAGQLVEVIGNAQELNGAPGQLFTIATVNAATRIVKLNAAPAVVDISLQPRLRRWDNTAELSVAVPATGDGWITLEDGVQIQFTDGSYKTGDYWLIPARTATASVEWPFTTPQAAAGIEHHYARLALLHIKPDDGTLASAPFDCRRLFLPLTPAPLALHVIGVNWINDDIVMLEKIGHDGLQVVLDGTIEPASVNPASYVVSVETILPAASGAPANTSLFVNAILAGSVSANANVIQWKLPDDISDLTRLVASSAKPPRVRVTVKGRGVWNDQGSRRRYLDGQAFGQPGLKADGHTARIDLQFPSGAGILASDFESWFDLGQQIPPPKLKSISVSTATIIAGQGATGTVVLDNNALTGGATIALSSSNPNVVTVPANVVVPAGQMQATFPITTNANLPASDGATITASLDSVSAGVPVAVQVVSVTVSPGPQVSMFTNRLQQFSASVAGTDNQAVIWSVQEPAGGSVNATGMYTAPSAPGTYHVVATSAVDQTKAAVVVVSVAIKGKEIEKKPQLDKFTSIEKLSIERITPLPLSPVVSPGVVVPLANPNLAVPAGGAIGQPFITAEERPVVGANIVTNVVKPNA